MAVNGGMEAFTGSVPTGWTANDDSLVSRVGLQGRVHSGNWAVNLADEAVLFQEIAVEAGCFHQLSFFARGEGSQVGVTARVLYLNAQDQPTQALLIQVRQQDMVNSNRVFAHYQGITSAAPGGNGPGEDRIYRDRGGRTEHGPRRRVLLRGLRRYGGTAARVNRAAVVPRGKESVYAEHQFVYDRKK